MIHCSKYEKTWFLGLGRKLIGDEALVVRAEFNGLFKHRKTQLSDLH